MMAKPDPTRALLALVILTSALYLSLLAAPSLSWDDDSNIFANPFYLGGLWRVFWSTPYFGLWVPVTSTVWQTLSVLGGGAAWPFRLLNAGLHVANVLLVFRLARRVARASGAPSDAFVVFATAIFALHPLQVEAVAWISGGRDLLATFFALLVLDLYFSGRRWSRTGATLAFAAAALSKPNVVVLPLVIFALAPSLSPREPRGRHAGWLGAWMLLGLFVVWVTSGAQVDHLTPVAWWQRPWLVGDALWFYESRLFDVFALSANYARTPAVVFSEAGSWLKAVLGFVVLGAALGLARPRGVVLAWALFLLPVSGIVSFGYQRISGVADHYAYPALAMVAAGCSAWRVRRSRLISGAALAVLVMCVVITARRLDVWRSNAAFFADMARAAPTAYATAIGMSAVACTEQNDFGAGVRWTEIALRERPRDVRALANQAYCLNHAGAFDRTVRLGEVLTELDRPALARTQPTGYASFIASVGAARMHRLDLRAGYRLLCEAERLFPNAPPYAANLAAAREMLARAGLPTACE